MIDDKPKVGRFIITESSLLDSFVGKCFQITKISGKRIYFLDGIGLSRYKNSFAAICDKESEYLLLKEFDDNARAERVEMKRRHRENFAGLKKMINELL